MATCTFTRGATAITIRAPVYPEIPSSTNQVLTGYTWGGGIKKALLGVAAGGEEFALTFRLDNTDYVALKGFLETTLVWGMLSCTYTDSAAAAHTNMYYTGKFPLDFASAAGSWWRGKIPLWKDQSA